MNDFSIGLDIFRNMKRIKMSQKELKVDIMTRYKDQNQPELVQIISKNLFHRHEKESE